MSADTVLLVGGGTGGHVFPMVAVADALKAMRPRLSLVFVGTSSGLEARVVPQRGYPLEIIEALPLRGAGLRGTLRGSVRILGNLGQARDVIKKHHPRVVFSLGGYAAGAISLAARLAGVPLALMEPNSVAGLANRLIAPFVQRAYIAFEETARYFPKKSLVRSGVALRAGFEPQPYQPQSPVRVLVLGGSQGAQALNEVLPAAVAELGLPIDVVHQVGRGNAEPVNERYRQLCPAVSVSVTEFIDDMPQALARADLIVGRAGASAVSEICAIGRPSILVPYPYAAGDHQRFNALALQGAGAALCVVAKEATAGRLAQAIRELVSGDRLSAMAHAAAAWGRPHAAQVVARDLLELAGLGSMDRSTIEQQAERDEGTIQRRIEQAGAF